MFTSQGNHTLRLLSYYTSKFFSSYSHVFCIHNYTCTIMSYLCDYLKLKKNSISHEQKFKTTYTVLKSSNKTRAYWAPQFYKKSVDDCWQTLRYLSWRLFKDVRSCFLRTFLDRSSVSQILHHISFLLVNLGFTMPIKVYWNKKLP